MEFIHLFPCLSIWLSLDQKVWFIFPRFFQFFPLMQVNHSYQPHLFRIVDNYNILFKRRDSETHWIINSTITQIKVIAMIDHQGLYWNQWTCGLDLGLQKEVNFMLIPSSVGPCIYFTNDFELYMLKFRIQDYFLLLFHLQLNSSLLVSRNLKVTTWAEFYFFFNST